MGNAVTREELSAREAAFAKTPRGRFFTAIGWLQMQGEWDLCRALWNLEGGFRADPPDTTKIGTALKLLNAETALHAVAARLALCDLLIGESE